MVKMGEELGQCCQIQNSPTKVHAHQHSFSSLRYNDGHAVAQLVEALGYKPEGHGFDS